MVKKLFQPSQFLFKFNINPFYPSIACHIGTIRLNLIANQNYWFQYEMQQWVEIGSN